MADGRRRQVAPVRKLVAAVLGTFATFVILFGAGMTSWAIVALGVALLALAIGLVVVTAVRTGARAWVAGIGHVHSVSEPPASSAFGRCELQIVIDAPGLPPRSVKIRDPRVPVAKWPDPGATLPIMVAIDDQRHVRILWDEVLTHAEAAAATDLPPAFDGIDPLGDDILIEEDAPPWARGSRDDPFVGSAVNEPMPDDLADDLGPPREEPVVVRQTPGGTIVLEGTLVEPPSTAPLPRRPRPSPGPGGARRSGQPTRSAAGAGYADTPTAAPSADRPTPGPAASEAPSFRSSRPGNPDFDLPPETPPAGAAGFDTARDGSAFDSPASGTPDFDPPHFGRSEFEEADLGRPDLDPADFGRSDLDPADFDPADFDPAGFDPADFDPADFDPADFGRSDLDPADFGPVRGAPSAASSGGQRFDAARPATPGSARGSAEVPTIDRPAQNQPGSDQPGSDQPRSDQPAQDRSGPGPDLGRPAGPPPDEIDIPLDDFGPGPTDQTRRTPPEADRAAPDDDAVLADLIAAQPSARPGESGPISGVGITLLVTNLDRSVAFYRDTLGFFEIDGGDGNAVLASGPTRLVLRAIRDVAPINRRLVHLNLDVTDVKAVYEDLRARGVRFTYAPRAVNRGAKLELWAAAFRDPDGHGIALTQWRSRSTA